MTNPQKTLVLLVNLGTPDAPTAGAIRRYLSEFLHDYRVVDMSRWLWCLLLHGIILPLRCGKVAKKYQRIWLAKGSPLWVHSQSLCDRLQHQLPHARVQLAMRYGNPSIASVLAKNNDIDSLIVLPLYPQYSATTTAAVFDAVSAFYRTQDRIPNMQFIAQYFQHSAWLDAMEARIRNHWDLHGKAQKLLFSFHGIPQRFADRGDPYPQHCEQSAMAIAARLQLEPNEWQLCYQSRFGREPWLLPATETCLSELAKNGTHPLDIICPGFAVDCLETLDEIAIEYAHTFQQQGGSELRYISALNDEPGHVAALAQILEPLYNRHA